MRGEVARLILRRFPCLSERRRIKERGCEKKKGKAQREKDEEEVEEKKKRRTVYSRRRIRGLFMRIECVRTQPALMPRNSSRLFTVINNGALGKSGPELGERKR